MFYFLNVFHVLTTHFESKTQKIRTMVAEEDFFHQYHIVNIYEVKKII